MLATEVTNYQCPACTGPLHFVGDSGKVECDYCGSSYTIEEIEAMYAEKDAKAAEAQKKQEKAENSESDDWGEDAEKMRVYNCPSCGAQLFCDENTAATSCPYCGNPTIVPGKFGGTLRPDYILPFKLSKEDAKKTLKEFYKGKILLPNAFTAENHIEEIKGIYVPFWLFDAKADVDAHYRATNTEIHREGDYRVTSISHYDIGRAGTITFEAVPVDGSSKMPDDFMDSIEPYDYRKLEDFSTAFLPGYLADKYDVDAETAMKRADDRCKNTASSQFKETVKGYGEVHTCSQEIQLHHGDVTYALLPVWLLSTQWNGSNYLFAMNGQTGKMVGDLPVDPHKIRAWFLGVAASASVLLSVLFSGPLGRMIAGWLS